MGRKGEMGKMGWQGGQKLTHPSLRGGACGPDDAIESPANQCKATRLLRVLCTLAMTLMERPAHLAPPIEPHSAAGSAPLSVRFPALSPSP